MKYILMMVKVVVLVLIAPARLCAASFTINSGQVITAQQNLLNNEAGVIEAGGQLNVTGSTAIVAGGANVTLNNDGGISASGVNARGINATGANFTIHNGGNIVTTGNSAAAIRSTGDDAAINNRGNITTSGNSSAFGIASAGLRVSITHRGSIVTSGSGSHGINVTGADATILLYGDIETSGASSAALRSTGMNASIHNIGNIVTTGTDAYGMVVNGSSSVITQDGTIQTSGLKGHGVLVNGSNSALDSNGTIVTSGDDASGIRVDALAVNTVVNHGGIISTSGNAVNGFAAIAVQSADSTVNHSGSIVTSGIQGQGIRATGDNVRVGSSGSISTSGSDAVAIYSDHINAGINHSGYILTAGDRANGISALADNADVAHGGIIHVTGTDAVGIAIAGANSTITTQGIIIADGNATQAIQGSGNADVLNINAGSKIVGSIDLGAGSDVVNIYSQKAYTTLVFANVETINAFSPYTIVTGNSATVIDPTRFTAEVAVVANLNAKVQQLLQAELNGKYVTPVNEPVASALKNESVHVWGQVFGGNLQRRAGDDTLAFDYQSQGAIAGYEAESEYGKTGMLVACAKGKMQVNTESLFVDVIESDALQAGVYHQREMGEYWKVNGSVMAGMAYHASQRTVENNINGVETVKAEFGGRHIAPAMMLKGQFNLIGNLQLRPSVQAGAIWADLAAYDEYGTQYSGLQVASRSSRQVSVRSDVELAYQFESNRGEVGISSGTGHRQLESQEITVASGTGTLQFELPGVKKIQNTYLGGHLNYLIKKGWTLMAQVESVMGDEESMLMSLGFKMEM